MRCWFPRACGDRTRSPGGSGYGAPGVAPRRLRRCCSASAQWYARSMQANEKLVQEQQFETAAELWNALSPTSDRFGDVRYRHLMFRGQPDSSMKLIPSAFRASNPSRILWQTTVHGDRSPSEAEQVTIELAALRIFADYADDTGIRIPNDSQTFRNMLLTPQHAGHPISWPDKVFFEILTLAQHHGVCTRLLDWTLNPYIAIYFAASSAMARHDNSELAIWIRDARPHEMGVRTIKPAGSVSLRTAAQHSFRLPDMVR